MINGRAWLLFLALAAEAFMLPGLSDPYYVPRTALVAALCLPLLLRRSDRQTALAREVLVGLVCWAVAAYFSQDPSYTLVGYYGAPFDCFAAVVVAAAVVVGVGRLDVTLEDAAGALALASIPLSLYALVQRVVLNHDPLLSEPLPGILRVVAAQGWPVYLGAVLAVACAAAIGILHKRREWDEIPVLALALGVPAIWCTGTRGAILAVAAAAYVALPGRAKWWTLAALPAACLARAHTFMSDVGRIESYKIAWRMFLEHPLVGVGPGAYPMAARRLITDAYIVSTHSSMMASQHAHNQVLHVLATTGLIGLAGYLTVIAGLARVSRHLRDRPILLIVAAAYAVVASLNPVPFSVTVMLAILCGAAAATAADDGRGALRLGLAAAALVSLGLSARLMAADVCLQRAVTARGQGVAAMRAAVDAAARFNPWELRITAMRADVHMAARTTQGYAEAVEIAHQGILRHVNDSSAHEIYGRAVLLAVMAGLPEDPREALMAFERAQQLAPTFEPLMVRRRALAIALGKSAAAAAAEAELAHVRSLERGGA